MQRQTDRQERQAQKNGKTRAADINPNGQKTEQAWAIEEYRADYRQDTDTPVQRTQQPASPEEKSGVLRPRQDETHAAVKGEESPLDPVQQAAQEKTPEQEQFTAGSFVQEEERQYQTKEPQQHEEPLQDDALKAPVVVRQQRYYGRRRYGVPLGAAVLLLALAGVVALVCLAAGFFTATGQVDEQTLRDYDTFLAPVVMQDPAPFSEAGQMDPQAALTAALWRAISVKEGGYTSYDSSGRSVIPLQDVQQAARDLFGPSYSLAQQAPAQETYFTFEEEDACYHVSPYSVQDSYSPYTEAAWQEEDAIVLRVGYVSALDPFRTDATGQVQQPTPEKYMEFVLQPDGQGNYYLAALRQPSAGGT
ncbi:MAG TPA: hypothetical protein IAA58_11805 [Candidatus Gallacutalibacter stercoravium]|nr:hypothetical protein [Candidatus Gallacutalibacter stercoravium]